MSDAAKPAAPAGNTWAALLAKAAGAKKEEDFTLVVLGNAGSGKTQLLARFKERRASEASVEYLLDYSYVNVKNVHDDQDADEIRARGKIVEMNHPEQAASLLPFFLKGANLAQVAYVVCVDLSRPWEAQEALDRWMGVLNAAHSEAFGELPEAEQQALMERVSRYNQFYVDPSVIAADAAEAAEAAAEAGAGGGGPRGSVSAPSADLPVDLTQPPRNLGVPLVLVGTKADALAGVFAQQQGVGDRFEYLSRRLRTVALEYGAALVFTSATAEGTNTAALQEYLYHRVYGFPHTRPAVAVGSDVEFGLFVPSGYDSADLIGSVNPARCSWEADAGFDAVFRAPAPSGSASSASLAAAAASASGGGDEEEVKAEPNDVFFKTLKFNMNTNKPAPVRMATTGPRVGASAAGGGAGGGGGGAADDGKRPRTQSRGPRAGSTGDGAEGDGAVKNFFKNLLANKSGGAGGGKQNVEAMLSKWKEKK